MLWDARVLPTAIVLTASPPIAPEALRFEQLPQATFAVQDAEGYHALWREQHDERQIWILPETEPGAPVAALIALDSYLPLRVESVLRLWERLAQGVSRPVLPLTVQQRRRLILMLRALDGRHEHATYREIAAILLDPDVARQSRRDWLTSPRRAQIIRIVKDGVRRMEGGYRDLLRG